MENNIVMLTDSYKVTHWPQYPKGTQYIYSYFESRGGVFPHVLFFGLQYFLKKYLVGQVVTKEKIIEAKDMFEKHFNSKELFNEEGWDYILKEHEGRLPVCIKAVPEGTIVDNHNVLMTIENTDPKCYWLTNYLETLLVQVWYPTTVATQSHAIYKLIEEFAEKNGENSFLLNFKLHDFGFRGVSSVESAGIGGVAHLVNFLGTDTIEALRIAKEYYSCDCAGFSIPASEHSTITAWGAMKELNAMDNMVEKYWDQPIVACVSDSYDIYNACEKYWGTKLKDKILRKNGTMVIRPDSGNPKKVILKVLGILWDKFGGTINEKGYKVLDPHVRVIQGDGVDIHSIEAILEKMDFYKFSVDNIAFGMGGALLQKVNRDTQKFAFKCSHATINGEERGVFKAPVTDLGKISKSGKFSLIHRGNYMTVDNPHTDDIMREVFRDGGLLKDYDLSSIRKRVKSQ